MAQLWDSYFFTSSGGNLVYVPADNPNALGVTVEDSTTTSFTTATTGDEITDSASDGPNTFVGTLVENGVTYYVTSAGGGGYILYVPAGSPVDTTDMPAIPAPGSPESWDLTTCFIAGTMIATPDGERAVESLAAGDLVLTADGSAKPVRWLGRTTRAVRFSDPARVLPIRIKAGAFGENLPTRDLLVSPGHAIMMDGVLVNAAALVNGSSVFQDTTTPELFTYFHVELDSHDLLLAEGVATESLLISAAEMTFDNIADRPADLVAGAEMAYPRVKAARQVPTAIRTQIAARAAVIEPAISIAA